jgi:hypothetical protein
VAAVLAAAAGLVLAVGKAVDVAVSCQLRLGLDWVLPKAAAAAAAAVGDLGFLDTAAAVLAA